MTLDQLFKFAEGDPRGPSSQIGLTVEGARRLVREIEAAQAKDCPPAFQIPTSCDAAPYESMSRARIDRMHQVDEAIAGRSVL